MHYLLKVFYASVYSKIVPLLTVVLAFFAPIYFLFYGTVAAILLDLLTGLIKAKKIKTKITSNGIRQTIMKLFVYNLVIALIFLIEYAIFGGVSTILSKILFALIMLTEVLSICENMDIIFGTKTFSMFYKRFKEAINKFIGNNEAPK